MSYNTFLDKCIKIYDIMFLEWIIEVKQKEYHVLGLHEDNWKNCQRKSSVYMKSFYDLEITGMRKRINCIGTYLKN